jgi:hypothetical protein
MRLPKPRYSLATLLILMTAIAIALWAVPEWREFSRRKEFERAAAQLKPGPEPPLFQVLPEHAHHGSMRSIRMFDVDGHPLDIYPFYYKNYWYCVYAPWEPTEDSRGAGRRGRGRRGRGSGTRWTEVRIYRLPPAPANYAAKSKSERSAIERRINEGLDVPDSREQYMRDFYQVISGREKSDLGIEYELIHVDRPDK